MKSAVLVIAGKALFTCVHTLIVKSSFVLMTLGYFLCVAGKQLVSAGSRGFRSGLGSFLHGSSWPSLNEQNGSIQGGKLEGNLNSVCFLPMNHTPNQVSFAGRGVEVRRQTHRSFLSVIYLSIFE